MKKNEVINEVENMIINGDYDVVDQETMQQIIEDNIGIIPRNQLKKYKSLYEMNTQERAKKLLECIIILNTKIRNAEAQIDEKKKQLNKLEERIILGKVNEKLGDRLGSQLNNEISELSNKILEWRNEEQKKQLELRKVNENMKSIIQPDGSVYYQTEYDIQKADEIDDIDEQIALVRQVIDKVILDRPSRNILNIEIHNKVDNEIEKLSIDTFRHKKV